MVTADPVELEQIEREYAAVIALLDRSAALRHAAALVPPEVNLDVGFAAERIDDLDTLSVCAVSGNRSDALQELVIPAGMGLSGKVASLRHPIAVADYLREAGITHDFDPQWRAEGLRAAVAVPISRGHWFYGVLCGAAREPGEIPDRKIDAMMRLARQTGLAIEVADHAREMADVAVHEERRHLALTIHDSVGAILFSIGAATRDLETERECEPALRARLKYIEQQVAKASAQLRQALRSLNEVPQEVALGVSLRAECRALEERTGMKAGCVVLGDLPALEEGRAKVLLQAAREALHNAEKHAKARSVVVSLHAVDGGVSLVVADDGVGLGPAGAAGPADEVGPLSEEGRSSTGLGLEATADRLGRVGGQLVVSTNEDGGMHDAGLVAMLNEGDAHRPPDARIRLLVVDDHPVVVEGVSLLVHSSTDIVVTGSARSAEEAVAVARQTRPDVVLLDLRLPDMLASEAVKLLRMAAPKAKIVIFTAYAGHRALKAAMEAGVDGCLLKDAADTDLVEAIRRVARGESVFDARLERDSLPGRSPKMPGPELTRREYEVLRRVAIGETNPEIAEAIGLSRNTVKTYLQSALQKLGARNRVEAIARASEFGLL